MGRRSICAHQTGERGIHTYPRHLPPDAIIRAVMSASEKDKADNPILIHDTRPFGGETLPRKVGARAQARLFSEKKRPAAKTDQVDHRKGPA